MNDRIVVFDPGTYDALIDVLQYILDDGGDASDGTLSPLEIKASIVLQSVRDQEEDAVEVGDGQE